jgi:hypothetical protein
MLQKNQRIFKREHSSSALLLIVFCCLSLSYISVLCQDFEQHTHTSKMHHALKLCQFITPTHPQQSNPPAKDSISMLPNCVNSRITNSSQLTIPTHPQTPTQNTPCSKIVSIHIMYCKLKESKQVSTCNTRCMKIK